MPLGLFTPPSGRGLVIPFFFRGFFSFGGHLPQTPSFRSAKEILVVSFATQPRAFILSDRNIFYTPRGKEQRRGLMPLGLFLSCFFCGHLPQTSARSKQYLPIIFVRLALFRQNFMKVGVENYRRFNGMKIPSMKARMKVLASFEAGMNSPNLPWHVSITSLKHRSRFGEVPCFRQVE